VKNYSTNKRCATLDVYDLFSFVITSDEILSEFVQMRKSKDWIPAFAGMTKCCEVEYVWQSHDIPLLKRDKLHERKAERNIAIRLRSGRVESASRPRLDFMLG